MSLIATTHYLSSPHDEQIRSNHYRYPTVMTIAGFDSSGGAGIQADIKTIHALGCYATSVLTALPVQNTQGVTSVFPIPDYVVEAQLQSILDDMVPDAIKIGMIHTDSIAISIAKVLQQYPGIPIVFDPVMVSSSGHPLVDDATVKTITEHILPLATLITPNMDEANVLSGLSVKNTADMLTAGEHLKTTGCPAVLMKGGHLNASQLTSFYFAEEGTVHEYHSHKLNTGNTHGTGCTLSSAIAAYVALGTSLEEAVLLGQQYVHSALWQGADVKVGKGKGPLNHFFAPVAMIKRDL